MSIIVLQAALAAYAVITFAIALRMRTPSRVVTLVFPTQTDLARPSVGRERQPVLG